MSDQLIGWLRTVVPAAWPAFVTWLATLAVPDAIVYPLIRAVEAHLPDWLTRVLLGSCKAPTFRDRNKLDNP